VLSGLTFSTGMRCVFAITRRTRAWIVSDIGAFVKTAVLLQRKMPRLSDELFQ
jgi:hypothetical protein